MNEQRLIDLELKFSFQDAAIEELKQTVHDQYLVIEKLEKKVKLLSDQLKNSESEVGDPTHKKPPHY